MSLGSGTDRPVLDSETRQRFEALALIERDVPAVGPMTAAELHDIARKCCAEIAWINSDVTAEGLSGLILTAECGFYAASRLRRGLAALPGCP